MFQIKKEPYQNGRAQREKKVINSDTFIITFSIKKSIERMKKVTISMLIILYFVILIGGGLILAAVKRAVRKARVKKRRYEFLKRNNLDLHSKLAFYKLQEDLKYDKRRA